MEKSFLPLVTIVTETYKNFDYLEENIKSVLSQTYAPIEYIIADDGSGNFPLDKVKKIIKQRLKNTTLTQTVHCLALMCCICGLVNITLSQETIESWLYASFFCFKSRMRQCAFV